MLCSEVSGLDIENRSSFSLAGNKPGLFDRLDTTASVYLCFEKVIKKDFGNNLKK